MKCDECGFENKEIARWQDKNICQECFNKLYPVRDLSRRNMKYLFDKYKVKNESN